MFPLVFFTLVKSLFPYKIKGLSMQATEKKIVITTKSFVKIGITKIFCYNNKIFGSINKTFGCCGKIFGCSNKNLICP